jgi:hypothetical protein
MDQLRSSSANPARVRVGWRSSLQAPDCSASRDRTGRKSCGAWYTICRILCTVHDYGWCPLTQGLLWLPRSGCCFDQGSRQHLDWGYKTIDYPADRGIDEDGGSVLITDGGRSWTDAGRGQRMQHKFAQRKRPLQGIKIGEHMTKAEERVPAQVSSRQ